MLDTAEETDWLRRHLVKHVASNICEKHIMYISKVVDIKGTSVTSSMCQYSIIADYCFTDPYETVTFFIGGLIEKV